MALRLLKIPNFSVVKTRQQCPFSLSTVGGACPARRAETPGQRGPGPRARSPQTPTAGAENQQGPGSSPGPRRAWPFYLPRPPPPPPPQFTPLGHAAPPSGGKGALTHLGRGKRGQWRTVKAAQSAAAPEGSPRSPRAHPASPPLKRVPFSPQLTLSSWPDLSLPPQLPKPLVYVGCRRGSRSSTPIGYGDAGRRRENQSGLVLLVGALIGRRCAQTSFPSPTRSSWSALVGGRGLCLWELCPHQRSSPQIMPQPRWREQKQRETKSIDIFRKLTFSNFYTRNKGLFTCTISERGKGRNHYAPGV